MSMPNTLEKLGGISAAEHFFRFCLLSVAYATIEGTGFHIGFNFHDNHHKKKRETIFDRNTFGRLCRNLMLVANLSKNRSDTDQKR